MLRWKAGTALFDVLSTVHLSLPAEIINLLLYQFENSSAELSVWSSPGSSTIARRRDNQEIHSSACAHHAHQPLTASTSDSDDDPAACGHELPSFANVRVVQAA